MGLFNDLSYPICIDLKQIETEKACSQLIEYIENIQLLKDKIAESRKTLDLKYTALESNLENELIKIIKNR